MGREQECGREEAPTVHQGEGGNTGRSERHEMEVAEPSRVGTVGGTVEVGREASFILESHQMEDYPQ